MQGISLSLRLLSYIPITPAAFPVSHVYYGYHISHSVQEHFEDQRSPSKQESCICVKVLEMLNLCLVL